MIFDYLTAMGFQYFFWKRAQMTNLASYKSINILTLIYLPSWALNSIGPIVAEILWNCAEHVEFCRVVNWYSIIYYWHMMLIPVWTNTRITTYMLTLLYNIKLLFIYSIMVFFFCNVVSGVYWVIFGPRVELHASFLPRFWSAILEVFAPEYFLWTPIFDNPRGSLGTWHSQFSVPDMVYIQILVYID